MSKTIKNLLLFFLITCAINPLLAQKKAEKKVRQSFELYKTAILNDRGTEAVEYLDSRTIQYYADILVKIRTSDSLSLNGLSLMDKLMVFSIRHRSPKEKILAMDGRGLLIYAIEEGMVGKNSVINNSIGEVEVDGNFAKGQFVSEGQVTPFYFHFYKEDKTWKIDLTSVMSIGGKAFKQMQMDSGLDENEYIFYLLEIITGQKPSKEVWLKIE